MDKIEDIDVSGYANIGEELAKQIRQQIGRELFERHHQGWVHSDDIKEICKLPPYDKK